MTPEKISVAITVEKVIKLRKETTVTSQVRT